MNQTIESIKNHRSIRKLFRNARKALSCRSLMLALPEYTFPVAGLVVGYSDDFSARKPRLSLKSFIHEELYNEDAVDQSVEEFDRTMTEYYKNRWDKAADWS